MTQSSTSMMASSKRESSQEESDSASGKARRKVGSLDIPKIIWANARDIFWCRIQTTEPFPENVDTVATKCFEEAIVQLSAEVNVPLSVSAIHTVSLIAIPKRLRPN